MADNSNDMIYTAADFERYHLGKMPEAEMHALEKAALEDPFLQDALDGFALDKNIDENVSQLQARFERMQGFKKNENLFTWMGSNSRLLRAAAIIAFIAGTAYFIYKQSLSDQGAQTDIPTLAENVQPKNKQSEADTLSGLHTAPVPAEIAVSEQIEQHKNTSGLNTEAKTKPVITAAERKRENEESVISLSKNDDRVLSAEAAKIMAPKSQKNDTEKTDLIASGKVVNMLGEPIANATLEVEKQTVVTDISGNFSVYLSDSTRMSNVAAVGYEPERKRLKADNDQLIVLNNSTKKESYLKKEAKSGVLSTNYYIEVKFLEPQSGWANYQDYVSQNLRHVLLHTDTAMAEIIFDVNELGKPHTFRTNPESVTCPPCNAEAIRLLNAGPAWKYDPTQSGILRIKFYK